MKKIILFIILILANLQLWGNIEEKKSSSIDSIFIFSYKDTECDSIFNYFSGILFYQNRNLLNAISFFEQYLNENPEGRFASSSLYHIAESYLNLHFSEMAIAIFSEVNNKFPFSRYGILSLKKLGDIYFSKENYSKAKLFYTNFIYHNIDLELKDFAFFQIERCNYYLEIYTEPTEIFNNFLIKYPQSKLCPELIFELGNYYFKVKKFKVAIKEYNRITKIKPEVSWLDSVYFQLSLSYKYLNDWKNSILTIKELLNRFPDTKLKNQAYDIFIDKLLSEKDFLSAIDILNSIINTTPQEERNEYYQILANIYEQLGLYKEVLYIYQIMLINEKIEENKEILRSKIAELEKITEALGNSIKPLNNNIQIEEKN
ncbi:MAG: tetratricopeptide repeat protein [Candidatus Cloacimonetes bacterium]|nr:tetratricopeptide repeat protein [Candidatus Cloacimonadota bacterium]